MGLLTPEAQELMRQRLEGLNATDSTDTVQHDEQVRPDEQRASGQEERQEQSQAQEESAHNDKRVPEQIPYSRFQKEIQRRKTIETELQLLRSEMEQFKRAPQQTHQPKNWIDELLEDKTQDESHDKYTVLEQRVAAFEAKQAESTLDNILSNAQKAHPDMPQEMVLAAIANGKSLDDAVETWENLKQMVLKQHGGGQVPQRAAPAAAPVLKSSGVGKVAPPKPRSMEEAHAAFNSWMRTNLK